MKQFHITVRRMALLQQHVDARGMLPQQLAEKIVEMVLCDNIVSAVLDDNCPVKPLDVTPTGRVRGHFERMGIDERKGVILRRMRERNMTDAFTVYDIEPEYNRHSRWYPAIRSLLAQGRIAIVPRRGGQSRIYYKIIDQRSEEQGRNGADAPSQTVG